MSINALETLCAILENGGARFRLAAYPEGHIETLRRAELFVQDGVIGSVPCDSCDHGHVAAVMHDQVHEVWGYRCPEAGFVETPPQEIAAGQVHLEELLSRIASALDVTRRARVNLRERILPIGNFWLGELQSFAYLAMRLSAPDDYASLHAEIRRRPFPEFGAVFMTAEGAVSPFLLPANHHLISLRDIGCLNASGCFSINKEMLRAYVPKSDGPRPGRPSGEEATWKVIEHLFREEGTLPKGQNASACAISAAWSAIWPGHTVPVKSTLKSHLKRLKPRIENLIAQSATPKTHLPG